MHPNHKNKLLSDMSFLKKDEAFFFFSSSSTTFFTFFCVFQFWEWARI